MYAFQTATAFTATTNQSARPAGAMFVMIFLLAVGIARSWELLGLRGGGLLDFLVTRAHRPGEPKMPEAGSGPASRSVGD